MAGKAAIGGGPVFDLQQPIQALLQSSQRDRHAMRADCFGVSPPAQLQPFEQQRTYPARQLGARGGTDFDQLATTAQQMSQTGLVHRMLEPPAHTPAIAHQKPVIIRAQHPGRLFEAPPRLNRIHRRPRSCEGPHPPESAAHFPTFQPVSSGVTLGDWRTARTSDRWLGSALRAARASARAHPPRLARSPNACSSTARVLPYGSPNPLFNSIAKATAGFVVSGK